MEQANPKGTHPGGKLRELGNERALWARYAVAHANRWMGVPQTTHSGLTAQIKYIPISGIMSKCLKVLYPC